MSMLLIPLNPSQSYPRCPMNGKPWQGEPEELRLSWVYWYKLADHLKRLGVNVSSLSSSNPCNISARKCWEIADAISDLRRVPPILRAVAREDEVKWRNCGGFRKV